VVSGSELAGGRRGHRGRAPARGRRSWLLAAGVVAIVLGSVLGAPTVIESGGWAYHPATSGAQAGTVLAPPPGSAPASDVLGGSAPPAPVADLPADGPVGGVDFDIIVPSLGYRATVDEGTGADVLARGPGHYATTAWPGRAGNVGIAAHNTYWIALGNLRPGDRVEIQTRHGLFAYAIREIRVVNPDDRTVLAPTSDHRLTMTTCYPLWAGAWATQRLIFVADEVGGVG
jgi:sortase A